MDELVAVCGLQAEALLQSQLERIEIGDQRVGGGHRFERVIVDQHDIGVVHSVDQFHQCERPRYSQYAPRRLAIDVLRRDQIRWRLEDTGHRGITGMGTLSGKNGKCVRTRRLTVAPRKSSDL